MGYWNHNTAFHPMIVDIAEQLHGDVLDVGCGDGLLVERLAKVSRSVTGIDRDPQSLRDAEVRTATITNASVLLADFMTFEALPGSFDLLTFVASLHHLDLVGALERAARVLRPGGRLVVVGLSANKTAADFLRSVVLLVPIRIAGQFHLKDRAVRGVAVPPREGIAEIRRVVLRILPGAQLRQAFYYRYVLNWTKPSTSLSGE